MIQSKNNFYRQSLGVLIALVFFGCSGEDDNRLINNPYLNQIPVSLNLNLNLPQYNALKYPGNFVVLSNQGIRGVVIYNVNNSLYTAFDLSDPNHSPNNCSTMTLQGVVASCQCSDNNSYDLVTGQHQSETQAYPMLPYRAQRNGDVLVITN